MSYLRTLSAIAYKVLPTVPDMPDYHLMVGTAERHDSIPLVIPQAKIPKTVAEQLVTYETMSSEEITEAIANNTLEINDFNANTAILTGLIGGVR